MGGGGEVVEAGVEGRDGEGTVDGRAAAGVEGAEERGRRMYGLVGRKGIRGGTTGGVGTRGGATLGVMGKFVGVFVAGKGGGDGEGSVEGRPATEEERPEEQCLGREGLVDGKGTQGGAAAL